MKTFLKMKKNHLDELFANKLDDFEISPSEQANDKFMALLGERNQQKASPFKNMRWYAAAASLVFISLFSWYFLNSQTKENKETMASVPLKSNISDSKISTPAANAAAPIVLAAVQPTTQKATQRSGNIKPKSTTKTPIVGQPADLPKATGVVEIDELIQDELTIALQNAEQKRNIRNKEKDSKSESLFKSEIGESKVVAANDKTKPKEESIYLPEINQDSPVTISDAREMGKIKRTDNKGFMAKVFTDLRHLRHGELYDANKNADMTQTSLHLSEDSFLGHEAQEMKERWNWVKSKLNKN